MFRHYSLAYRLRALAQDKELAFDQIFENVPSNISKPLPNIIRWLDDNHYLESRESFGKTVFFSVEAKTGITVAYELPDNLASTKEDLPDAAKNVETSPDGKWVAYTLSNNLFVKELSTGRETQYTFDGSPDIYNGNAAWIYYEEIFGRSYRAFWWSPDSRHLAFMHFDETHVPVFPIYNSKGKHGSLETWHYPQAGDCNPSVKLGIISVGDPAVVWADFNDKDDQYFGHRSGFLMVLPYGPNGSPKPTGTKNIFN